MSNLTFEILKHQWSPGGVSAYPLTHPIVGQGTFYKTFDNFIHLVEASNEFTEVFAIIAQWGVGKSRLAYELIAQINRSSRGWYYRDETGQLTEAELFRSEANREQYLGLYIRYSQIANEHQNSDNWFSYGLYKALLPLATAQFDGSIQSQIAKEAYDRLITLGFDESKLAKKLEISKKHSNADLYEHPHLVTQLCEKAYAYLQQFGIKYILIALDELETVAETTTYGLEDRDIKHMDGRAIKLLGKAIKEEDPRSKLPWLRYVALCSPAIGDELREIQSTARRFELVNLSQNAFADVSDFVRMLAQQGRLGETYPEGLVEAAYAMSGGNFGWFNVIMANVDSRLRDRSTEQRETGQTSTLTVGNLFDELVQRSSRMRDYVLDYTAIAELRLDRTYLNAAKDLLYGQLPVPLNRWQPEELKTLLSGHNEYDEQIAVRYRQVEWDELACSEALRAAKFHREQENWFLASVSQPLSLRQLLDNLSTYAIYAHQVGGDGHRNRTADGKRILLIPLNQTEFIQLVGFLYTHPAMEEAARALWQHFIGLGDLANDHATHLGPSIAMLARLNLRYRKQNQTSLIFRDPDRSTAHEQAMAARKKQPREEKAREILTGVMRVLDENWEYDPVSAGLPSEYVAIATGRGSRGREQGGLVTCDALRLHPKGRVILAWVQKIGELEGICHAVQTQSSSEGKTPLLVFTTSRALVDVFGTASPNSILDVAKQYMMLYQLSTNEEYVFHRVGLPRETEQGFQLDISHFNTTFTGRITALRRALLDEIHQWRRRLNAEGWIAYPLRPSGTLKESERQLLFQTWRYLMLEVPAPHALYQLDETSGINVEGVVDVLQKLKLTTNIRARGYADEEQSGLFNSSDDVAGFPMFLVRILERLLGVQSWSLKSAEREWFWSYTWEGAKPKDIFTDWLSLATELGFAVPEGNDYKFLERNTLENRIQEAQNWLEQDYPGIVLQMQEVFGEEEINLLFRTQGTIGTKTAIARDKLQIARTCFIEFYDKEVRFSPDNASAEKQQTLIDVAKARLEAIAAVHYVYSKDEYEHLSRDENVRTLDFRSEREALWKRIRRAELFATKVLAIRDKIKDRIDALTQEMRTAARDLPNFPVQLFTLSLEKIRNILDGALQIGNPQGSTAQLQMTDASALGQCLRDLRVGDAMNRLAQLGREVGIDVDNFQPTAVLPSLEQVNGQIGSGFRQFKTAYEKLQAQLKEAKVRLDKLEKVLRDAPNNFQYPNLDSFEQLKLRPGFIEDSLAAIQEDEVEALREEPTYDRAAKQGDFRPLMQAADSLLRVPMQQLNQLNSNLLTLENAVRGYLRSLLEAKDVQLIEHSFNTLLRAKKQPPRKPVDLLELEAGSLKAAVAIVQERRIAWVNEANTLLQSTGISFERWQHIVEAVEQEKPIDPEEADKLVREGLLVRTYRLGGSS